MAREGGNRGLASPPLKPLSLSRFFVACVYIINLRPKDGWDRRGHYPSFQCSCAVQAISKRETGWECGRVIHGGRRGQGRKDVYHVMTLFSDAAWIMFTNFLYTNLRPSNPSNTANVPTCLEPAGLRKKIRFTVAS